MWSLIFLFLFSSCGAPLNDGLLINEVCPSNKNGLKDEAGETEDWVEIYNNTSTEMDLSLVQLSNDRTALKKWKFPENTLLPSKSHLIIWLDDEMTQGKMHASFKIRNGIEALYLSDGNGKIIDSIPAVYVLKNQSLAREKDASSVWIIQENATPGKSNLTSGSVSLGMLPAFSHKAGIHSTSIQLSLAGVPNSKIIYTVDGSEPKSGIAKVFEKPIKLDTNTVVKARLQMSGYLPGPVVTRTFLIKEKSTLPIVSISADPIALFDTATGMYEQFEDTIEIPAHFEYFSSTGVPILGQSVAIRISGHTGRAVRKKSIRILTRSKYGPTKIEYPFFLPEKDIPQFEGLILRADATSAMGGNLQREIAGERIRNELFYYLNKSAGYHTDMQAMKPTLLFINGKYWGIYTLMERKGVEFIRNNYPNVKKMDLIDDEDLNVLAGSITHYEGVLDYMNDNDIEEPQVYHKVISNFEILSLLDNFILNAYIGNFDLEANIRFWRPREPDGKYRYINIDKDGWGFDDDDSIEEFMDDDWADEIYIHGRLSKNPEFKTIFVNRLMDLLNTSLSTDTVQKYIHKADSLTRAERPRDRNRWQAEMKYMKEDSQIAELLDFAEDRPDYMREELTEYWELDGPCLVRFEGFSMAEGKVKVNTVILPKTYWNYIYMKGFSITLEALPEPGYEFVKWESPVDLGTGKIAVITLKGDVTIRPVFRKIQ